MIVTPLFILMFVVFKKERFDDHLFQNKFGSLYEGLKTKHRIHLMCNVYFTLRRLLLIATIVFCSNYPAFQIMTYAFLS